MRTQELRSGIAAAVFSVTAIVGSLSTGGCTEDTSLPERILEARKANVTPSRFVEPVPVDDIPSDRTLLLFIHGIFGDTVTTWCHKNGTCLPKLILDTPEFAKHTDAFVFGFPSAILEQGSFSIPEAAKTLYSQIQFHKLLERYPRIVIVAHSMGGLVALEALTTFEDLASKVPLVVTYATPYNGAQIATLGKVFLTNPALADMVQVDTSNSFLTSLTNDWKTMRDTRDARIRVVCAYEKIPIAPLLRDLIVPQSSGIALCDTAADAIPEDHIGIVKPGGTSHYSYMVLVNALRDLKKRAEGDNFVDASVLPLLAQVPDSAARVAMYKRMTRATNLSPAVVLLLNTLHLSGDPDEKFSIKISEEQVASITEPSQLAALAPVKLAGLPCGGKLEFQIKDDLLTCANGDPIANIRSPNSGGPIKAHELIVFHSTMSRSLESTLGALMNSGTNASAHILVGRDGSVVQLLPFSETAWHVGGGKWRERDHLNSYSIGIELVNAGRLSEPMSEAEIIANENADPTGRNVRWEEYPPAQIEVATAIARVVGSTYGIREIAGHCHVAPGRKLDPGPDFPFAEIEKQLGITSKLPPCGEAVP